MMGQLTKIIELKFWDFIIPMLSNSIWLRVVIKKLVSVYRNEKLVKQIAAAIVIACAGFASGFLIFSITAIFA
ncbi:MAG: hypothetical protein FD147_216 [Chloroflexi bacterium]|nr:MAG: hypothetical protein FD147_216 [Chloroflexota bacterium]MBA4374738.1 hypothetical protein [Anaerolinea sp.]